MAQTLANSMMASDPLKGLLMDKGGALGTCQVQNLLRKLKVIHGAMGELATQQRLSSQSEEGVSCLELYLATNLRPESSLHFGRGDVDPTLLTTEHTRAPVKLEWRAIAPFTGWANMKRSARVHAFTVDHPHSQLVKHYVSQHSPAFYEMLMGYDAVRQTLNYASKQLRRMILDLGDRHAETAYLLDSQTTKIAEGRSRRIIRALPSASEVGSIIQSLQLDQGD